MLFSLLGYLLVFYAIYYIFIYPYFLSPYRHLPRASQPFLLKRLLFDPASFDLVEFAKTPSDGLVRYFGFLNQERLFPISAERYCFESRISLISYLP